MLLNVGDKAPDFTLPDANENDVSLKDYSGRKLVLWFFPKANTPG
jgi:peroxiredoxin Q/BCP